MKHIMKISLPVIIAVLFIHAAGYTQISMVNTIESGGISRSYRIYVPEIYDVTQPTPLVLNLHGLGSNALEQEYYGDFRPIADTANFIIVTPDGTDSGAGGQFWNAFGFSSPDDVGFILDLIDEVSSGYTIDQSRIYSTGMSNGGFMSYTLACELSSRIAAIASVTGTMTTFQSASCTPSHPMPVMQIHGTADATVPYAASATFMGIEDLVNYWVDFNNCNQEPVFEALEDINTADNCTAEHFVYDGGAQGSTVELYKIIGGGHSWPGAFVNINTTNMDFNASKEIWRFFSQFDLDQLTSISERVTENNDLLIYPNPTENEFMIKLQSGRPSVLSVYNEVGSLIMQSNVSSDMFRLNLETPGVYVVSVKTEDQVLSKRIVKY